MHGIAIGRLGLLLRGITVTLIPIKSSKDRKCELEGCDAKFVAIRDAILENSELYAVKV
jgi:hypothetical protein